MPWTMTYQKYQIPTNQACPKSQSTCSTFGTSELTQIISPFPSKHISTTTPKVKESPWLSEDSANTDVSIDSDREEYQCIHHISRARIHFEA